MSPLHGLRLNCILAPLAAAAVGAAAVGLTWRWHAGAQAAAGAAADRAAIAGLAGLLELAPSTALPAWLAAHRGWRAAARVQVRDGLVVELERAGDPPVPREATPDLMLAYQAPRALAAGDGLAVAAPCLRDGGASLVIGWRAPPSPPPAWPWLALGAGVLALGGGLGAYLVARVYRPVEWMQRAAEAATRGEAEPPGAPAGPETASLRSSIALLASGRRRGGPDGDDHA